MDLVRYKMDLDFLGLFSMRKTHLTAELHGTDLKICDNFRRVNPCLII